MRSEHFHTAIKNGTNRFEICRSLSRGVRLLHAPGVRVEDSITKVFSMLHLQQPIEKPRTSPAIVAPAV